MKEVTYITFPVSITGELLENLDQKYQNIGWIYNPYGDCWTHYFHKKKDRNNFIKYIKKVCYEERKG